MIARIRGHGNAGIAVEAGQAYVSPLYSQDRSEELFRLLEIPNDCEWQVIALLQYTHNRGVVHPGRVAAAAGATGENAIMPPKVGTIGGNGWGNLAVWDKSGLWTCDMNAQIVVPVLDTPGVKPSPS